MDLFKLAVYQIINLTPKFNYIHSEVKQLLKSDHLLLSLIRL